MSAPDTPELLRSSARCSSLANGIIAGQAEFKPCTLPILTGTGSQDRGNWPIGNPPTGKMSEMSNAEYRFQNSDTFLNGIGVATRMVQENDKSKRFCPSYDVHATKDNQLTLKEAAAPSNKDFYNDSGNWPSDSPTHVETTVHRAGGDIKIAGSTEAPRGLPEPRIYTFVVNIG